LGRGEPYLLVAFFKVDGETNTVGVDAAGFFIKGPCTFRGTAGTHGNLGDSTVKDGDDVPIPRELGRFEVELKPITAADFGQPEKGIGGFCGVVVALVEENETSDEAAESGHRAFDQTVERLINEILPTLRQDMADPLPPGKLGELKNEVADRVKAAVFSSEFWSLVGIFRLPNADDLIGADVFVGDQPREIHARLQRFQTVPPPGNFPPFPDQQILEQDYELFGSIAVEVIQGQGTWEAQRPF
jgi:hypothetical protein